MHSLFALTILVGIFSFAECKKYHPYNIPKTVCTPKSAAGMKRAIMDAKCKPRPTLVDLAPLEGYEFMPSVIIVNQCIGSCKSSPCLPGQTRNVTRYHRRLVTTGPRKGMTECTVLEVEEHETCSCMCHTMARDCNDRQNFNDQKCQCECKEHETNNKANCEKDYGMQWMEDTCDCKCMMMNTDCSSGFVWDHIKCTCTTHAMKTDDNDNQNLDEQKYERKYKKHETNKAKCEEQNGMEWMEDICECKCMMMHQECTSGKIWDHLVCKCVV